jgi:hypothetical protein
MFKNKRWWAPIAHFATHTVVGTVIFAIIGTPAILLGLAMHWLEHFPLPHYTVTVLEALEKLIVSVDAALYVVYLVYTFVKAVKELR